MSLVARTNTTRRVERVLTPCTCRAQGGGEQARLRRLFKGQREYARQKQRAGLHK